MAKVGDIFTIPIGDGRIAIGQVYEKRSSEGLGIILVFEPLLLEVESLSLEQITKCIASKPAFMANSFDSFVDRGDWKILANIPPVLGRSNSPAFRIAGLPLGLILESYDRKRKRLVRFSEINAAPANYSISPKGLENAVKAYFKAEGAKWEARFNRLLFKNIIPFGQ